MGPPCPRRTTQKQTKDTFDSWESYRPRDFTQKETKDTFDSWESYRDFKIGYDGHQGYDNNERCSIEMVHPIVLEVLPLPLPLPPILPLPAPAPAPAPTPAPTPTPTPAHPYQVVHFDTEECCDRLEVSYSGGGDRYHDYNQCG